MAKVYAFLRGSVPVQNLEANSGEQSQCGPDSENLQSNGLKCAFFPTLGED